MAFLLKMINIEQARLYCAEDISLIEGYNQAIADQTQRWVCHHRRGLDEGMSKAELIANGLYKKRPASELIFLTEAEHHSMHKRGNKYALGCRRSDVTKNLIRQKMVGNKNPLGHHHTEAARELIRQSKLGENNPSYGTHWFNNGFICVRTKECPPGFKPGRLRI